MPKRSSADRVADALRQWCSQRSLPPSEALSLVEAVLAAKPGDQWYVNLVRVAQRLRGESVKKHLSELPA